MFYCQVFDGQVEFSQVFNLLILSSRNLCEILCTQKVFYSGGRLHVVNLVCKILKH